MAAPTTGHRADSKRDDPRAAASRLGLSREKILAAALELLDRGGLDQFTMRRLAGELGIGTMTLYGYFRSKDELIDAVLDAYAAELSADVPGHGPWKLRLRQLMIGIRQSLAEHPAVIELRFKRPLISRGALELSELGMEILLEAGFSKRQAANGYRSLFNYTFGFAAFGAREGSDQEREQTFETLAALPREQFPALAGAAKEAADTLTSEHSFEFGLDLLLEGLGSLATATWPGSSSPDEG